MCALGTRISETTREVAFTPWCAAAPAEHVSPRRNYYSQMYLCQEVVIAFGLVGKPVARVCEKTQNANFVRKILLAAPVSPKL